MTKRDDRPKDAGDLRQRAEELARETAARATEAPTDLSPEELRRTLHELRVHQIELEMQNEELRRAQAEIDAARARYFDLYDLAPAGYCTLSEEGLILEANLTLATLLGLARAALLRHPLSRFVLNEDQDIYYLHRRKLFETREPHDCDLRLVKPDGVPFWAHLKETTARAEDGATHFRVMITDITERKRRDEELREAKLLIDAVIENIPLMVFLKESRDLRFVVFNRAGEDLLGYDRKELLGKNNLDLFPPEQAAFFMAKDREVLATDVLLDIPEEPIQTAKKGERLLHTRKVSIKGADGVTKYLLGISEDITERRHAEIRLAQADRLSTMGTLAAGIAHEINNPLTYVLCNLESLSQDVPKLAELMRRCHAALCSHLGADVVKELLEAEGDSFSPTTFDDVAARFRDVLSGAIRIQNIARGLSTFSRVEGSEVAPVHVHHAAEQAITLALNQIKFRARLVKDFGQVPLVLGSDSKLAQVFLNLLINAAHSIDEGHVEHNEIRIRTWADDAAVFVEVSDTGKGIAREHHDRIFEPFFTTKEVGAGSGLGLSISRNIVTAFGGEISFSSEPGKGTRFLIRLPRLPEDSQASDASTQADAPPRSTPRGRILVVDDEQGIRAIIARMLGRKHEVVTAASGEEAEAILEKDRRFDLIYCDLMMPRISGMELHAWLAERDAGLAAQLVFMTGGAFTPGASAYLARVGNLRVEKPFDTVVFRELTDELVLAARGKLDRAEGEAS
jgi:two-component system cell cycle sensor histidine kinase/response regulator CckA